ncbi:DUF3850 domain-containing protein [Mesorhizobium sp. NBSH29]|uniref:DUF3850 domain-containing protein n=1 Tax=Mesorhizobium sp. NBSH29 TaxID=2654249 RepID=UPI001896468B|nr:DUF3850 domain-containing protein [Mesorhizobium sp. NBSH29]QPC87076.1 DUF3850 domain-containing protein [Mesorhizobium sp. NBSH29]
MTQIHYLRTIDRYFDAVRRGEKTFEVRLNDRAFQTGDIIILRKISESGYAIAPDGVSVGYDEICKRVTYLLQGGQFGIEPRYCILGLGDAGDSGENHD